MRPDVEAPCEKGSHVFRYSGRDVPRDDCEAPKRVVCLACGLAHSIRCSASARSRCGPCSKSYRHRVRRVFLSGWTDRPTDRLYFVTLTAPSERGGHLMPSGQMCPCTPPDGIVLAEWHARLGRRWNDFVTDLRREFGDVQYAKAAEVQEERGAVHFHAFFRCEADLPLARVRKLAMRHGFGHEVDLKVVAASDDAARSALYASKYASKSADARSDVDWLDLVSGEIRRGWPRLRVWTASRGWGDTMAGVKAVQAAWARTRAGAAEASDSPAPAEPDAEGVGPLDPNPESYAQSRPRRGEQGAE